MGVCHVMMAAGKWLQVRLLWLTIQKQDNQQNMGDVSLRVSQDNGSSVSALLQAK